MQSIRKRSYFPFPSVYGHLETQIPCMKLANIVLLFSICLEEEFPKFGSFDDG